MTNRLPPEAPTHKRVRPVGGFTLIELLVVVAIIALLISILLPSLGRAKELANRTYCAANMRSIGTSLMIYSQEFNCLPACRPPTVPNTYINGFTANPVGAISGDYLAGAITANQGVALTSLWMLTLRGDAPAKMLICKSDHFVVSPASIVGNGGFYANFQDSYQISYSIAYPWSGSGPSYAWRGSLDAQIPLACDMAPLNGSGIKSTTAPKGSPVKVTSSSNHDDGGQNVMFGDCHVDWCRDPYVGASGNDNIFTAGFGTSQVPAGLNGIPGSFAGDVVMVPVRDSLTGGMGQ